MGRFRLGIVSLVGLWAYVLRCGRIVIVLEAITRFNFLGQTCVAAGAVNAPTSCPFCWPIPIHFVATDNIITERDVCVYLTAFSCCTKLKSRILSLNFCVGSK